MTMVMKTYVTMMLAFGMALATAPSVDAAGCWGIGYSTPSVEKCTGVRVNGERNSECIGIYDNSSDNECVGVDP